MSETLDRLNAGLQLRTVKMSFLLDSRCYTSSVTAIIGCLMFLTRGHDEEDSF